MVQARETKSKVHFLVQGTKNRTIGTRPEYMNSLNRYQVSTIFKARTRMLDTKNNFRGKYNNITCRGCGANDETQAHVLNECRTLHQQPGTKVTEEEIFDEDVTTLKRVAEKIQVTMKRLQQSVAQ